MAAIRDYTKLKDYGKLARLLAEQSELMEKQGERIAYRLEHSKGEAGQVVSGDEVFEMVEIEDEDGDLFEAVDYVQDEF